MMSLNLSTKTTMKAFFLLMILAFTSYSSTNVLSFDLDELEENTITNTLLDFNATKSFDYISTQLDFGFRVPGTVDHENCGFWIGNQLSLSVDEVIRHNFTIQKESQPLYNCQNILGKLNTEKKNIVILASHWDSRNVAEKDYVNQTLPIPGANDGASGVGVLLELSRVLNLYKETLDCEIWFLFLDAEDQGSSLGIYGLEGWNWAEGASEFAENIHEFYNNNERIECFILLDMVGGFDLQFIKEGRTNDELHNAIFDAGRDLGYNTAYPQNPKKMLITDDHVPFYELGIPVIDLIIDFVSGNWTYHHTHLDNLENIDPESLKITGETIESFIKTYYTEGDNLGWNNDILPSNLTIVIISVSVVTLVFIINFLLRRRKRRR